MLAVGGMSSVDLFSGFTAVSSTEVISPSAACSSFVPPPVTRESPTSLATPTASLICGGHRPYHQACIAFNTTSLQWTNHSQLTRQRTYSSAVVLASGAYVLGGDGEDSQGTSDFLPAGSTTWQPGPSLPAGGVFFGSCLVPLNSGNFLLIGGDPETTQVREYNEITETWRDWPNLGESRVFHSCLRQSETIIVVGGQSGSSYQATTTLIHLDGSQEAAGNLSTPRSSAAMAVINGRITIFGGANENETALATAEVFNVLTKTWSISSEISLQTPRFGFALLPLPLTAEGLCSST